MRSEILPAIEAFMQAENIGEHRFGILAASNGRLVERLRAGRRVWPETEDRVREFIASRRPDIFGPSHPNDRSPA